MAKAKKRPAEAWVYVLRTDRALPLEQQSRFTLRPMTYAERAGVLDDFLRTETAADGAKIETSRVYRNAWELALEHIVSVENFPVGAADPWPQGREARVQYLDLLDNDDLLEIGNEVWTRSGLGIDGDAIKNSSAPELTSRSGDTSADQSSTTAPPAPSSPA